MDLKGAQTTRPGGDPRVRVGLPDLGGEAVPRNPMLLPLLVLTKEGLSVHRQSTAAAPLLLIHKHLRTLRLNRRHR